MIKKIKNHAYVFGLTIVPHPAGTVQNTLIPGVHGVINNLLVATAIVALVFMLIGGVRFIIAQGDEDQVRQAKNTLLYASIGLLVIGLAAAIVNFVIGSFR